MMLYPHRLLGLSGRLFGDLVVLLWTAAWVFAGWQVYRVVMALQVVADGISGTGHTFNRWIAAFRSATPRGVPGLSGALSNLAGTLQRSAGDPLVHNGMEAQQRIEQLAVVLGVVTAFAPILVVLFHYGRWRWSDVRERSAAAAFVRAAERSGRVEEAKAVLAHRAVSTLPFRRLMKVSANPIADLAAQRYDMLAAALLRRSGVAPLPPARAPGTPVTSARQPGDEQP
jgi:hypothetical protein